MCRFIRAYAGRLAAQALRSLHFTDAQLEAAADYAVLVYGRDGQLDALGPMSRAAILGIFHDTPRQDG